MNLIVAGARADSFSAGVSTQAGPSLRLGVNYQSYVTPTAVAHGGMGQVQLAW